MILTQIMKNGRYMEMFRYLMGNLRFNSILESMGGLYRSMLRLPDNMVFFHLKMGDDAINHYSKMYGVDPGVYAMYMLNKYTIELNKLLAVDNSLRGVVETIKLGVMR